MNSAVQDVVVSQEPSAYTTLKRATIVKYQIVVVTQHV